MSKTQSQLSTARGTDSSENRISQPQSQVSTSAPRTDSVHRRIPEEKKEEYVQEDETSKNPEPTVSSLDPEERKQARRLRIARRNEAIRKAAQYAEGVQVEEGVSQKTRLESQVENSAKELERLLLEGRELVTNVRVANDSREVARRFDETAKHESRTKRLEEDVEITKKMYEEVEKKWKELSSSSDPMDLKAEIDAQKEKCDILLDRKDMVIKQLITEVEVADARFVCDQLKQKRDIAILVERIENHVKLMRESYRDELQLIEDAIVAEKKELVDTATENWQQLYEEREKQETENLNKRFQDIEDQENEVQKLRTEHRENYRSTKIQLETDLQTMQKEMEQIKFQCFLNSEKLDYNYQILHKREEENIVIRAQQKRRLNKLQDTLTNLRRRIRLGKEAARSEAVRLNDEVIRLHDNILSTERKADYFANINDRKYHKVWDMNEETARKLLDRIYTIDKIIHEQQLGYEWKKPDTCIPCKTDLPSFRTAMQAVSKLFQDPEESNDELKKGSEVALKVDREADELQGKLVRQRLLKHILQRIADASGFLIEDRLTKLLEPYTKYQKTIVLLDNVFDALGFRFEADIEMLREYFLPYAVCTECPPPVAEEAEDSVDGSGLALLCPTEHHDLATGSCDETDELEEIPPPPPKFSFDSEEVSGICPFGKDVGILKAADEEDGDSSEPASSFPREDAMSEQAPLGTEQALTTIESAALRTEPAPLATESAALRTDQTTPSTESALPRTEQGPTAKESVLQRTEKAPSSRESDPLGTESASPGTGSTSQKTSSKASSRKTESTFRKTDPITLICKTRSAPVSRSGSAPSKTGSASSKRESSPSRTGSPLPQTGSSSTKLRSSPSRSGSAPPQTGLSSTKLSSSPSGTRTVPHQTRSTTSKTGSAPPRTGSTLSRRQGISSGPTKTDLAGTRAESAPPGVGTSSEPPQIVVSEFLPGAPTSQQIPGTSDGAFCIEFNASLTLDFGEDTATVPMLPKCPVPPAKECVESHTLEIQPIYVFMALNDFVSKFHSNELSDIKSIARILSRKRNTVSRMLSAEDVTDFWECYRNAFPDDRRRLWEGFQKGLNKYYQVLSQRHKLNMETMALKRQNEELKQLLANYVDYNEKMKNKRGITLPPLNLR